MTGPESWEESETNDYVPPDFDRMVRENDMRIYLYDTLQDQYKLQPAEAEHALQGYLASRTEPLPEHPEPFYLAGATGDAYAWWAGVSDPVTVLVRARTQQVAAIESDIAYSETGVGRAERPDDAAMAQARHELERAQASLREAFEAEQTFAAAAGSQTLYNPAYLDGSLAILGELVADENPSLSTGIQPTAVAEDMDSAAEDLAAAEAAITLLRENRDRHGYTAEDAQTARALRSVLDAARVWDDVTAPTTVDQPRPPEDGLRLDRVRPHPRFDDTVILDAGFAGATVTVQRNGSANQPGEYQYLTAGPGGGGPLRDVGTVGLGVIAAGDRVPNPARVDIYSDLGAEVRQHVTGLADAVAEQREALQGGVNAASVAPRFHWRRCPRSAQGVSGPAPPTRRAVRRW